jgi:hypothetical protein
MKKPQEFSQQSMQFHIKYKKASCTHTKAQQVKSKAKIGFV